MDRSGSIRMVNLFKISKSALARPSAERAPSRNICYLRTLLLLWIKHKRMKISKLTTLPLRTVST